MRGEDKEFGAFRVETDIACCIVGDSGRNLEDKGAGGGIHVGGSAQGGSPVEEAVTATVVGIALHINALSGSRLGRSGVFIVAIGY